MLLAYFFIQFIEVTIIGVLSRDESGPLRLRDENCRERDSMLTKPASSD
jgi:hypothetical protein